MPYEDHLKKLEAANQILNEKYTDLGVRPLEFSNNNPKDFSLFDPLDLKGAENINYTYVVDQNNNDAGGEANNFDLEKNFSHLNKLNQNEANKIESLLLDGTQIDDQSEGTSADSFKVGRYILLKQFFIPVVLLSIFVLTISSEIRENFLPRPKEQKENLNYAKTGEVKKTLVKVINVANPYIIASGSYASQEEALAAKTELEKIAGTSLKIKFVNDFYTVQIGPEYKEFDDAVLVYKELSKYAIKDLAIRPL